MKRRKRKQQKKKEEKNQRKEGVGQWKENGAPSPLPAIFKCAQTWAEPARFGEFGSFARPRGGWG